MTYLEFQVEESRKAGLPLIGSARFLIDDEDQRECVRRAVAEIRAQGWVPIMLLAADYSAAMHELKARYHLSRSFSERSISGYAFEIQPAVIKSVTYLSSKAVA
ncbi:MAG TPA: hypothetical protein VIM69_07605 [Opitutaceae bacterium]